jgi:hypothetical protein
MAKGTHSRGKTLRDPLEELYWRMSLWENRGSASGKPFGNPNWDSHGGNIFLEAPTGNR